MEKHWGIVVIVSGIMVFSAPSQAVEGKVKISAEFPGGNVIIQKNAVGKVEVAPDLRGGAPWFYWCFEATADQPGRVSFVFPEKVAGFPNGGVGYQGPAISRDLGKTWDWMGAANAVEKGFFYDFTQADETVRLAMTLPYLQSDLDAFLKANEGNGHLARSVLTQSRKGRTVELLQVGKPGPGVKPVLFTARHHACESIASFVLEGFMKAAIAATPDAVEFRKNYVLFAVPFVDKDGVEEGDQGKGRKPHDHNRDYGDAPIFPEIKAIQELGESHNIQFLLDFHCPTLRMEDHQCMYFDGPKGTPVNNFKNVSELARLIKAAFPPNAPSGPLVWLGNAKPRTMCATHFAGRKGAIMSTSLETAYAPPKANMDPASIRKYGEAILAAWVKTKFIAGD